MTTPDPTLILAYRAVQYSGSPAEPVPTLWLKLQTAIGNYEAAVASSLSSEGIQRTMDLEGAREQVIVLYHAYTQALAETATELPAGTDPNLMQRPMGHTVQHHFVQLPC